MVDNRKVLCAGCSSKFLITETTFHRRKRWCGDSKCLDIINSKVKHANYRKQQKKIKNGSFRAGVAQDIREFIKNRDNNTCQMCCKYDESYNMQVHHITPVSDGGTDEYTNLILLCYECHKTVHQKNWQSYTNKFHSYTFNI